MSNSNGMEIAIVGMACKFPGAKNLSEYYSNLVSGKECLKTFTNEELYEAGISEKNINDSNYVKRSGIIEDVEHFDNNIFNYTPRETELIDPQQRIFLQTAWEALEDAGYDPERYQGKIGVFAGCSSNTYLINNICKSSRVENVGQYPVLLGNEKDFLCTRVAFKLKLKGPCVSVQTGCSTSLVSVHLGCQSILNGDSDIVLAGGVTVRFPQIAGYMYQEGGIPSPDGFCRPFDTEACGTVPGDGVGVVVLKLLTSAIRDNDHIYSVIKATSINNDGADKVGFTAPSVNGQIDVMVDALNMADVDPSSISYIETHGTGTVLGDPIEFSALKHVYSSSNSDKNIAIGSVKANIGHTDVASGIAGLIKTSLMLEKKVIFPQINFKSPNPLLGIENSRMYVQPKFSEWKMGDVPRRAAVSSFGLGGTNAHAILEEPDSWLHPFNNTALPQSDQHLVMISAETSTSLVSYKLKLASFLENNLQSNLKDIAYTLAVGRKFMKKRFYCIAESIEELKLKLTDKNADETNCLELPKIIFQAGDFLDTSLYCLYSTYKDNDTFKNALEDCFKTLDTSFPHLEVRKLFVENNEYDRCNDKKLKCIATFVLSYALLQMLSSFNVIVSNIFGGNYSELLLRSMNRKLNLEQALFELVNSPVKEKPENTKYETINENKEDNIIILTLSGLTEVQKLAGDNIRNIQFDLKHSKDNCYLNSIGELWSHGVPVSLKKHYSIQSVAKLSLPTYCFDTEWYFITPDTISKKTLGFNPTQEGIEDQIKQTDIISDLSHPKIKEIIKKLWKEVLGVENITEDDDIYELCGDSFSALLMNAELEKEFNIKLSNRTFIESNTLDKLAKYILNIYQNKASTLNEHIVNFNTEGDLTPIFLIHPAGGIVMGYKSLVKHMPKGHPVYGIQYPFNDLEGKNCEMKDLAKIYINSINKIYPEGPLIIGGHSFGGNAAIEIVLQLEAAGRTVEHIIMFDSHPPKAYYSNTVFNESKFLQAFPIICGMFFGTREVPKDMNTESLESVVEYLKVKKWIPWGFNKEEFKVFYNLWRTNHNTLRGHLPVGKVKCNFLFFRAQEFQPQEILDTLNINLYPEMDIKEWSQYAENPILMFDTPGSHYTMLDEPNVNAIGSHLRSALSYASVD